MDVKKRMQEIIQQEANALLSIQVGLDFVQALTLLRECRGKVLTTGMGKAGYVASKFASTLCSTGTPAVFLHPGEAAHGDLGLITPGDHIVAFSNSGKTREVIETLEFGRQLGLDKIIGVTSHADSSLRKLSDVTLDMGPVLEACPLGLAPSTSIAVMLAISDALALTLMELKGITSRDYGMRHHGGYLGIKARENS